MRRLLRWAFHLSTALSLLLFLGVYLLWARSDWRADLWAYDSRTWPAAGPAGTSLRSADGALCANRWAAPTPAASPGHVGWRFWSDPTDPADEHRQRAYLVSHATGRLGNFHYGHFRQLAFPIASRGRLSAARMAQLSETIWYVQVPDWPLAVAAAVLPASWLLSMARRRRRSAGGLCHECGYDLRATPDRCPECGAVPRRA